MDNYLKIKNKTEEIANKIIISAAEGAISEEICNDFYGAIFREYFSKTGAPESGLVVDLLDTNALPGILAEALLARYGDSVSKDNIEQSVAAINNFHEYIRETFKLADPEDKVLFDMKITSKVNKNDNAKIVYGFFADGPAPLLSSSVEDKIKELLSLRSVSSRADGMNVVNKPNREPPLK